jgi:60S ribosome subunit biogenesis protein NIP7
MRNLTEKEMHAVFKKMAEYTGASLKDIIVGSNSPKADRNVFRVSQQRVYLVRDSIAKFATSVSRDKLLSLGTCLGKVYLLKRSTVG